MTIHIYSTGITEYYGPVMDSTFVGPLVSKSSNSETAIQCEAIPRIDRIRLSLWMHFYTNASAYSDLLSLEEAEKLHEILGNCIKILREIKEEKKDV